MKTAVVTDGKYRASLAAVRALGEAGYQVVVTQTREEAQETPASFLSRSGLSPTGAHTPRWGRAHQAELAPLADFLAARPPVLEDLNDKQTVHRRCLELGLPVPREYDGPPEAFPVVVKPRCGEKFGLKAAQRYAIAGDRESFARAWETMAQYGGAPIVQEKIEGPGEGVNLLLDREGRLMCAFCHRRLREYPVTGGPSTCCVSFYDETMIRQAYRLLASFGFVGMAMVEFKGGKILEVNPRVWGSFPMTACCGSPFTLRYAQAAGGERLDYDPGDFRTGAKMRYLFHDGAATLGYLRRGDLRRALGGVADFFAVPEALYRKDDKQAYRAYLRNSLKGRLG